MECKVRQGWGYLFVHGVVVLMCNKKKLFIFFTFQVPPKWVKSNEQRKREEKRKKE